jgi:excisionase family DNA binding protein
VNLSDMPEYLNVDQLAAVLQVPNSTIYQWRYLGEAPPGIKMGNHVRFKREDVRRWLDDRIDAAV